MEKIAVQDKNMLYREVQSKDDSRKNRYNLSLDVLHATSISYARAEDSTERLEYYRNLLKKLAVVFSDLPQYFTYNSVTRVLSGTRKFTISSKLILDALCGFKKKYEFSEKDAGYTNIILNNDAIKALNEVMPLKIDGVYITSSLENEQKIPEVQGNVTEDSKVTYHRKWSRILPPHSFCLFTRELLADEIDWGELGEKYYIWRWRRYKKVMWRYRHRFSPIISISLLKLRKHKKPLMEPTFFNVLNKNYKLQYKERSQHRQIRHCIVSDQVTKRLQII